MNRISHVNNANLYFTARNIKLPSGELIKPNDIIRIQAAEKASGGSASDGAEIKYFKWVNNLMQKEKYAHRRDEIVLAQKKLEKISVKAGPKDVEELILNARADKKTFFELK